MPDLELELHELIYKYMDEHPDEVPDLEEFVKWLYDEVLWNK